MISDTGLRRLEAAALVWDDIERWDNGFGRLTVRRSKTDATPRRLHDAGCDGAPRCVPAGGCGQLRAGLRPVGFVDLVPRPGAAGLGVGYSGHSGRVGMARRMAQGRWKSAGMVADYTRAENAERAAKWLG